MIHQAPLRVATIAMVEMAHGRPFCDEDLLRLLVLDNGDFQIARVRAFLTILVRCKALVCLGRGWTGCRFRPGRRWEQWRMAEPRSRGGNAEAYHVAQEKVDRLHDLWRACEGRIRQRVHDERVRQGISLRQLSASIGVHNGHLQRLEQGSSDTKRAVALPVLVRVAIGLGMSLDELIGWQEVRAAITQEAAAVPGDA